MPAVLGDARIDTAGSFWPSVLVSLKNLQPTDYGIKPYLMDDPLGGTDRVWNYDYGENYLSYQIELARSKIVATIPLWEVDWDLKTPVEQQRIRSTWLQYAYAHVYCELASNRSTHIGEVEGRGGRVETSRYQPSNIRAGCIAAQEEADRLAGTDLPPLSAGSIIGSIRMIRGS